MNTTTATIRTMIVDDEVLARQNVEALLRHDPDIAIVAQCNNGTQASKSRFRAVRNSAWLIDSAVMPCVCSA